MKIKEYFQSAPRGRWTTLGVAAISAVTAVVYAALYVGTAEYSVVACVLLALCSVVAVLAFTRLAPLAAYVQFLSALVALCFFIYGVYYYVSVVLVGIDLDRFSAEFIVCTILFLLTAVCSVVNIFMKNSSSDGEKERIGK